VAGGRWAQAARCVIPTGDVGRRRCASNFDDTTLPWKSDYDDGTPDAAFRN